MKSSLSRAPRRALHGLVALSWLAASVSGPHFASAQGGADGASEDLRALFPQRARIETLTRDFADKTEFFVQRLARGIATVFTPSAFGRGGELPSFAQVVPCSAACSLVVR